MQKEWSLPEQVYTSAAGSFVEPGRTASSGRGRPSAGLARLGSTQTDESLEAQGGSASAKSGRAGPKSRAAGGSSGRAGAGQVYGASSVTAAGPTGGPGRLTPLHPKASDEPSLHIHFEDDGHLTPTSKATMRKWAGHKGGKSASEMEARDSSTGRFKGKRPGAQPTRAEPPHGKAGRMFKMSAAPGVHAYDGHEGEEGASASASRTGRKKSRTA